MGHAPCLIKKIFMFSARRLKVQRLRSEEHTSELQSLRHLVCRLLLEKKKNMFGGYVANSQSGSSSFILAADPELKAICRTHGLLYASHVSSGCVRAEAVMSNVDSSRSELSRRATHEITINEYIVTAGTLQLFLPLSHITLLGTISSSSGYG